MSRPCAIGISKARLVPRHSSTEFLTAHYEVLKDLGRGSFSYVRLVRERETGHERVCKVVQYADMPRETLELTRGEIDLLAELDHPNIVKLYEYGEDEERKELVLILEFIAGGDCLGLLDGGQMLSEALVAQLMHQTLVAVTYCHGRGVAHRDLKPQNLMLTSAVSRWGAAPTCKIIDFGLALHPGRQTSRDFVGTPAYMAPEVLSGAVDYGKAVDMWSLGCTALELLAGEAPFGKPEDFNSNMDPVFEAIRGYKSFEDIDVALQDNAAWAGRSDAARDFARRLLRIDPEKRPDAAKALDHAWLQHHRPSPSGMSSDMLSGMAGYMAACPMVRWCLLLIAARIGAPNTDRLGEAFVHADADRDGMINNEELSDALSNTTACWQVPDLDVRKLLAATVLDQSGGLNFTEFVAACMHGRYKSLDDIAQDAFEALDDSRDGIVDFKQVRRLFRECDMHFLAPLPQDRAFGFEQWSRCVRYAGRQVHQREVSRTPREKHLREAERASPLMDFFGRFFYCDACEQVREEDDGPPLASPPPLVVRYDPCGEAPAEYVPEIRRRY